MVNLTPHPIQVICGEAVVARWEPSGREERRAESVRDSIQVTICGTPAPRVVTAYADHVEGLPAPVPWTMNLVSRITAAQTLRADVHFPFGEVRASQGRIIGCRSLGQFVAEPGGGADA